MIIKLQEKKERNIMEIVKKGLEQLTKGLVEHKIQFYMLFALMIIVIIGFFIYLYYNKKDKNTAKLFIFYLTIVVVIILIFICFISIKKKENKTIKEEQIEEITNKNGIPVYKI